MNPLVKKEIRLLLPSWLAVFSLAILLPLFLKGSNPPFELIPLSAFFGMILLGVNSFGREFSLGTFQSLLSQPIERRRTWRIKITVLFFAAALIMAGFFVSYTILFFQPSVYSVWRHYHRVPVIFHNLLTVMSAGGAVMLVGLVGGLWTTMLFRQAAAAFWITFLAPAGLLMLIFLILPSKLANNDEIFIPVLCGAGVIYSAAGFWFAHRLFHRAQDAAWTGGVVAFSRWRYFESGSQSSISTRHRRPIVALVKKELQLQSISWFCAAALLALHLAVIVMRKVHGSFERDSLAGTASEFYWALWLIMPLIIGGTMVAEERRLGLVEQQFGLPASRRLQFAMKFSPALIFGFLLGGIVPLLLEGFAIFIGAPNPDFNPSIREFEFFPAAISFLALPLGLSMAGFYASTLTKNFLQALGAAVVIIVGCVLFTNFAAQLHSFLGIAWNPTLTISMTILTALIVIPWLAYRNFNYFQESGRVWRRNVLGLMAATLFIFVSSAALYNRAWEVVEPAEPAHGHAKLSLSNPPILRNENYENLLVRLPDGRVWFDYVSRRTYHGYLSSFWMVIDPLPRSAGPKKFISGSNWVYASARHVDEVYAYTSTDEIHVTGYADSVGIQPDGTLWASEKSDPKIWTADKLTRFGDETNWDQLARSYPIASILLLKKDGTLWRWGTNYFDPSNWPQKWPGLRAFKPNQIGTNSDWSEISDGFLARKADGSVWHIWRNDKNLKDELGHETNYDQIPFQKMSNASGGGLGAYILKDGTLWVFVDRYESGNRRKVEMLQSGTETDWVSVATTWNWMVAIKSDGTLWKWDFKNLTIPDNFIVPPTRLGIHNDWVAVTKTEGGVVSLAADGSLWFWPNRGGYEYEQNLLKLPKQPQFLCNIFTNSN